MRTSERERGGEEWNEWVSILGCWNPIIQLFLEMQCGGAGRRYSIARARRRGAPIRRSDPDIAAERRWLGDDGL